MMVEIEHFKPILKAIIGRSKLFLVDEMGLDVEFDGEYRSVGKIELKKYTTMIGIGGRLNLLFYTTYDELLLDNLTKMFAYGTIMEDEYIALRESAAGEIANLIIGHALCDFPDGGRGITITPPITIEDAKSILKTNGTSMISAFLSTPYGNMEFNVIGSLKGVQNA